ncbi:metacaspase-7-like [Trifolium pratense]|uniref:metacaspase-7-like n=1 Tax=Trifolium pratense TaxID=57577 RepID=UPI001E69654B|nr:metacaspase-7-like [Trifolium pratense]XP_045789759.1 metacaspase-7-like [Trifolium pratense]
MSEHQSQGPVLSTSPRKRALLVGLKYQRPLMDFTHVNCKRMQECLVKRFGFPEEDLYLMLDTNLNYTLPGPIDSDLILDKLYDLIKSSKSGDSLVFYFSGLTDFNPENKRFIVGADHCTVDGEVLSQHLKKIPRGCAAMFIIDAPYGGGFIEIFSKEIVLFTSSRTDEDHISSGSYGSLRNLRGRNPISESGSNFTRCFLHFIEENNDILNQDLIDKISLKFRQCGVVHTPALLCTKEKAKSKVFRCYE